MKVEKVDKDAKMIAFKLFKSECILLIGNM